MSAPLVVNTKDGTCWVRRTVTRDGLALYAPAGVCNCPAFVMATLSELAEHGIAGSADVLPMPVGLEPSSVPASLLPTAPATLAEQLGDARPASTALLVSLAKSVRDCREHEHPTWEDLFCMNLTSYMGERMAPVLRRLVDSEAEAERLRARVAELETERHSTNEALSDAAEQLRADRDRLAELEAAAPAYTSSPLPPRDAVCARAECGHVGEEHHHGETKCWARLPKRHGDPIAICGCSGFMTGPTSAESADRWTQFFAPTQALRLDEPRLGGAS